MAIYNNPRNKIKLADLNYLTGLGRQVVAAGDYNARQVFWGCHINNMNGTTILNYTSRHPDINIFFPLEPTHYPASGATPTVIDLVINKNVPDMSDVRVLQELSSDHNPIMFKVGSEREPNVNRKVSDFSRANWKGFRSYWSERITAVSI